MSTYDKTMHIKYTGEEDLTGLHPDTIVDFGGEFAPVFFSLACSAMFLMASSVN